MNLETTKEYLRKYLIPNKNNWVLIDNEIIYNGKRIKTADLKIYLAALKNQEEL